MNQVSELRRVLVEEQTRLQAQPGLESRILRRAFSLTDSVAEAGGRSGESSRVADRSREWKVRTPTQSPRAMALVAALLAVAIVAALAFTAHALRVTPTVPVDRPHAAPGSSLLPVGNSWFFSVEDGAVQLQPNASTATEPGVYVTHDGGRTWLQTTVNFPWARLRWLDSQHIVAVVNNVGPPWLVETTADGGSHWQSTIAVPTVPVTGWVAPVAGWDGLGFPFFLDAHEGWALCTADSKCTVCRSDDSSCIASQQQNSLYHTVDSGADWQQLGKTFDSAQAKPWDLSFTDSNHGFMGANNTDGVGRLFVTNDGGQTWRLVELPPPPGGWQPRGNLSQLPTMFGQKGVLLDEEAVGGWFTYTTSDGGLTWGNPRLLPVRELQATYPSLGVSDPSNWWVVDGVGGFYRTADSGQTWQPLTTTLPSGYTLDSVVPVGGNVLWGTARSNGAISFEFPVRSTDGGATWSIVKLPASV